MGEWTLISHPNLPVVDVVAADTPLGWLLGWAVTPEAQLLRNRVVLAASSAQAVESWLYGHGGRFVCAFVAGNIQRLYLDPCGTLGVVYAADGGRIASTLTALHLDDFDRYAAAMARGPELYENHFYPAGLTADPAVRRLLPNHYLDLETMRPVRHWPAGPIQRVEDAGDAAPLVAEVVRHVRSIVSGLVAAGPAYLPLTAGRDARMLLACARPVVDHTQFVTFKYADRRRRPDVHIARKLARRLGLDHQEVPLVEPSLGQRREYLLRIGYAGNWGKARDFDLACRQHLEMRRSWLTGFGGEVGRAFYWREGDEPNHPPDPEALMARLYLPELRDWLAAWRSWQAGVPHLDTWELLDFLYIEQRMGCWAGPHMYGTAPFAANVGAFSHRRVIEAMMSLPPAFRRSQGLADAVIAAEWPEAGDLPFQRLTGMARLTDPLQAAARQVGRAAVRSARRALRKVIGPAKR